MVSIIRPEDAPLAFQSAWNTHDMNAFGAMFHAEKWCLAHSSFRERHFNQPANG